MSHVKDIIGQNIIAEARRLSEIELMPGNQYNEDVLDKIKMAKFIVAILDSIYVQDCHISGMHDPCHTPHSICEDQLRDLAIRVLGVTHGVKDWYEREMPVAEKYVNLNRVPRKIYRGEDGGWSWYTDMKENGKGETIKNVKELERWEKDGCVPREKDRS